MADKKKSPGGQKRDDHSIKAAKGSVVVGGSITSSTVITGNSNVVQMNLGVFRPVYEAIEAKKDLPAADREDLKAEVHDLELEARKGDKANESFIERRLRNIKRIAPDILDVALATMANPVAGLGMIAKKIAERMAKEGASG